MLPMVNGIFRFRARGFGMGVEMGGAGAQDGRWLRFGRARGVSDGGVGDGQFSSSSGGVRGHYRGVRRIMAKVVPQPVVTGECAFTVHTLILSLLPPAFISQLFPLTKYCCDPLGQGIALLMCHDRSWFICPLPSHDLFLSLSWSHVSGWLSLACPTFADTATCS